MVSGSVLGFLAFAGVAQAAPVIDPVLVPLLRAESMQSVTVILLGEKAPSTQLPERRLSHAQAMQRLQQHALTTQTATVGRLESLRSSGLAVRYQRFWLINAVVAQLPANRLADFAGEPTLAAINADHLVRLVDEGRSDLVAPEFPQFGLMADQVTYGLKLIQIPALREKFPQALGTNVPVGVLDTGVDAAHPDLAGKVTKFKDFVGTQQKPYDDHGHGTHVSGTIAGGAGIGVAPNAKIYAAKVFSKSGSATSSGLFGAMQWIADPDGNPATNDFPALISNSWGSSAPSASTDPKDNQFCQAVANWRKLGILGVFAAGNSGPRPGTVGVPGACPESLTVGAVDSADAIASFSSRGPVKWKSATIIKPDVAAPGVKVLSAKPKGGYQEMSGTSMATPHVAGLAALLYQAKPGASVDDLFRWIRNGSDDLGAPGQDSFFGVGRVNALKSANLCAINQ